MSEFTCEIPETEQTSHLHIGGPLCETISELRFPRKLESAWIRVYSGANIIGEYETRRYSIELLALNVVKITGRNANTRIIYNATIDVRHY